MYKAFIVYRDKEVGLYISDEANESDDIATVQDYFRFQGWTYWGVEDEGTIIALNERPTDKVPKLFAIKRDGTIEPFRGWSAHKGNEDGKKNWVQKKEKRSN
jgi:hypothetical protein